MPLRNCCVASASMDVRFVSALLGPYTVDSRAEREGKYGFATPSRDHFAKLRLVKGRNTAPRLWPEFPLFLHMQQGMFLRWIHGSPMRGTPESHPVGLCSARPGPAGVGKAVIDT